jgi:MoaA/NifB/PqqE/SkfB family radical SAM enzyme
MDGKRPKGYKCHAIDLTCLINANGDVYPCCFLFDDNNANSSFRNRYKIGSLSPLPKEITKEDNPLAKIWYENSLLNSYRQSLLPIEDEACYYCTRYFYQNELLNELHEIFRNYELYGIAEEYAEYGTEKLVKSDQQVEFFL